MTITFCSRIEYFTLKNIFHRENVWERLSLKSFYKDCQIFFGKLIKFMKFWQSAIHVVKSEFASSVWNLDEKEDKTHCNAFYYTVFATFKWRHRHRHRIFYRSLKIFYNKTPNILRIDQKIRLILSVQNQWRWRRLIVANTV